ncbi:hypothetical protein QU24_23815 [Pantoea rodasii]|uniref:Uncharacterized protein n=1 Tax=Pantoea rodasii TaxID=1076549 RepID=A0A0B1R390_9GAMM|nr:hypothetical protein [Pantoea rodasii]KHJ65622.1 hypothetical protein QU24_23815 [Pantoea rodasii]
MKTSYVSTLNAAINNIKIKKSKKIVAGKGDSITVFHNADGALGLTIALPDTDNSLVHFYRYGVNKNQPEKLYKSECLYSRREHFEYQDWLIRTITDEFTESECTLEQILGRK